MAQPSMNGQLRDWSLPDILQQILTGKRSGQLMLVSRSGVRAELGILRGNIAHVQVDNRNVETVICKWLQCSGRISEENLASLEGLALTLERSILDTLVAKHYISPEERAEWVLLVAEDLVCELLTWTEGTFEFSTDNPAASRAIGLNLSTEQVTMEGMKRIDEWVRLQQRLTSSAIEVGLAVKPDPSEDIGTDIMLFRALEKLGGRASLGDLEPYVLFGKFKLYDAVIAFSDAGYLTLHQDGRSFGAAGRVSSSEEIDRGSRTPVLLLLTLVLLLVAMMVNWMGRNTIGFLSSIPQRGVAAAEARFEQMKLHNAVLRYRMESGVWPTSLRRAREAFPLTDAEMSSSIGIDYRYQRSGGSYVLSLRTLERETP